MRQSPLAWLLVTPLLTVPLTAVLVFAFAQDLNAGELGLPLWRNDAIPARLHYFDFWPTWSLVTLPGLLNFLVVLWFFQRNGYMRVAAALAVALALVRTFAVLLVYFELSQSDLITHEGRRLIRMEVELTGYLSANLPETAKLRLLATLWLFGVAA